MRSKVSCLCCVDESKEGIIRIFHHLKKQSMTMNLRVWFPEVVKKLWLIWKCCRHHLTNIMKSSDEWIVNPCSFNLDKMWDDGELKDLKELCSNRALEMRFVSKTLKEYWCSSVVVFPRLCETALAMSIPFVTTCLCESGFSTLLSIKTKSRNCLNAQAEMRVAISNKLHFDHKKETGKVPLNWNTLENVWNSGQKFH